MQDLLTLEQALSLTAEQNARLHTRHLNPRLATILELIGASTPVTRGAGASYWDASGREYLDFMSGFGALSLGYSHPHLEAALDRVREIPNIPEGLSHLAAALAHNLTTLAAPPLTRVFFASSGAEAVDTAIKLSRAATGRTRMVACRRGFHGRTVGALSLVASAPDRELFEPLLPVDFVSFGDADELETALRPRDVAAFVVEPIQGEGGFIVPPPGYLRDAADVCRRYGTLLVVDEIQTGLGRTGRLFAIEHEGITPDVLLLGKALGGGLVPISALLTTEAAFSASHSESRRSALQLSTYGGHTRGCAVALATLEVLVNDGLPARAAAIGSYLEARLRELARRQPLIASVRGRGLMMGIELAPATSALTNALTGGMADRLSRTHFSGLVLLTLRQQHGVMTSYTLYDSNVIRLQPPLIIDRGHVDRFVDSLDTTLRSLASFPMAVARSWRIIRRAALAGYAPSSSP